MDRGAWWAAVHGVTKSRARLSIAEHHRAPSIKKKFKTKNKEVRMVAIFRERV